MLNSSFNLPEWAQHVVFPLVRWLHIICTTFLVGGTLFYEFVIPKSIEDLKQEAQLSILGRVRWVFRKIVIGSTVTLVLTGLISTWRQWRAYHLQGHEAARQFWGLHVGLGVIALVILVRLTLGDNVPKHPIRWLRVNLVILLVAIFAACLTRYVLLAVPEETERANVSAPTINSDAQ